MRWVIVGAFQLARGEFDEVTELVNRSHSNIQSFSPRIIFVSTTYSNKFRGKSST